MNFLKRQQILRLNAKLSFFIKCRSGNQCRCGLSTFNNHDRTIPRTKEEYQKLAKVKLNQPEGSKTLAVSILGSPNAGKSTLTNALIGWRVCSVSKKVHTTKRNTKAVLTENNTQILFMDTPGLISLSDRRKHRLSLGMLVDPGASLQRTQLILVLVDVSDKYTRHRLDPKIISLLEKHENIPAILVLNKVDVLKSKIMLLELTRLLTEGFVGGKATYMNVEDLNKSVKPLTVAQIIEKAEKSFEEKKESHEEVHSTEKSAAEEKSLEKTERRGWPLFKQVFMISALDGDGIEELKSYLLENAESGNWMMKKNLVTDQTPEEIAILAVREKLLDKLPHQIPYDLKLTVEVMTVEENVLKICMNIGCPEKHYMKFVIGPKGQYVASIADAARQELMNTFRCEVSLKLVVNVIDNK